MMTLTWNYPSYKQTQKNILRQIKIKEVKLDICEDPENFLGMGVGESLRDTLFARGVELELGMELKFIFGTFSPFLCEFNKIKYSSGEWDGPDPPDPPPLSLLDPRMTC